MENMQSGCWDNSRFAIIKVFYKSDKDDLSNIL